MTGFHWKSVLLCFQKTKASFVSSREELSFFVWEIIISREILYGSFSKRNGLLLLKTFSSVFKRVKLSFPSSWGTLSFSFEKKISFRSFHNKDSFFIFCIEAQFFVRFVKWENFLLLQKKQSFLLICKRRKAFVSVFNRKTFSFKKKCFLQKNIFSRAETFFLSIKK